MKAKNLFWALFGQISINAKLREPWQRSPWRRTPSRKKKIMKMSVQLKDTQPNICKLGAQHDARFGCSTGLGTRPVIDDTAPPGVECPMQIAFAFAKRRRNATFAVTNVPARQVNDGYCVNPTLVYIWRNQIYAAKPRDGSNERRPADTSELHRKALSRVSSRRVAFGRRVKNTRRSLPPETSAYLTLFAPRRTRRRYASTVTLRVLEKPRAEPMKIHVRDRSRNQHRERSRVILVSQRPVQNGYSRARRPRLSREVADEGQG